MFIIYILQFYIYSIKLFCVFFLFIAIYDKVNGKTVNDIA